MTLPIERARTRRPVTWLTLLGVLLLPVVIGGILVAALYNPVERLDGMSAAIVNEDEPVTVDGQLLPLGRQLSAGLVEGSDDVPSNLDWTISNAEDAAAGLADGRYVAVVTIPEGFSAAATSAGQTLSGTATTPEQATIQVQTAPDALIVDDAITTQITTAAASIMGSTLTSSTLSNVFIGYSTLGEKLGEAADGATQLASGAHHAATGAAALPGAAQQLSTGVSGLGDGADSLATGLDTLASKTRGASAGAGRLADGIRAGATQITTQGLVPKELTDAASGTAALVQTLADQCAASGASDAFCQQLAGAAQGAAGTSAGLDALKTQLPTEIAGQLNGIATQVDGLSSGIGQLAGGIDQSKAGATQLGGGATQLANGIGQLGTGAQGLSDGVAQLATGADSLADGIHQASAAVPSLSEDKAKSLADVLADPVTAKGLGTNLFGASAIPLLAVLALWFGGLGSFVALQAVSRRALTSRRPSALLALRSLAPAAAIGAVQGALVAGVVQLASSYDWGTWWVFAALCVTAGVAFAAVNQALMAVFGGVGRWISALVGVLAVATGIVSTVPGVLSAVAGILPTAPAYHGAVAALTSTGGVGAGLAGMVIWAVVAFVATTIAVARRRTTSAKALLAEPAAA